MNLNTKCQFCSSANVKFLARIPDVEYKCNTDKHEYFQCNLCHVVFISDPSSLILNEIYPNNYYSVTGESKQSGSIQIFLEFIKEFLDSLLIKKCLRNLIVSKFSVLDVGGGSGWMLDNIRNIDQRVGQFTVIDINENSRAEVESRGYEFIKDSIETIRLNKTYDFILLLNILEHVKYPRALLEKMYLNLNDGGIVLIKTPNSNSLNFKLFHKFYWGGYHCPRHFVLFDKSLLDSLVKQIGFKILYFKYTQGGPQWAASILGTFNPNGSSPMYKRTLFQLLTGIFAALDFTILKFFRTDQMIYILKK